MKSVSLIISVYVSLFFMIGLYSVDDCLGVNSMISINDVTPQQWKRLDKQKIFFGHQSVGFNILDGIRAIMKENPEIRLNLIETRDPSRINSGIFAHSRIGKNEDPRSKTDDFVKIMDSGFGGYVDIAFHKYCFIDVNGNTDVERLFADYTKQMNGLEIKYPDTHFIHFTIPLTTIQTGPKAFIKKMLGKPVGGVDANIKRNEFNKLLVAAYKGKEPVFDLAMAESTKPDGTRVTFTKNGKEYFALYKEYSSDGGHLNALGQKKIAEQLLIFLTEVD